MKRKILSLVFALSLVTASMFLLTACSEEMIKNYKLTVHYDLNGGEWIEGNEEIPDMIISYEENGSVHFTDQQPIKAGFVFGGWDLELNRKNPKQISLRYGSILTLRA